MAKVSYQIKDWIRRSLHRPGGRSIASLLMSARIMQKHGVRASVKWHPDGYWIFEYPEAAIPKETLHVDPVSPRRWEEEVSDLFFQEYTPGPGDIIVDVGAEIGTEINLFSRLVGASGHVYAIEAHPTTFLWLQRRIAASGLTNVTAANVAISDQAGTVRISDVKDSLENRLTDDDSGFLVRALTLDDFLDEHGIERIDYLKMNIEGAEQLAVRGMKRCLPAIANMAIESHDFLANQVDDDWYRTEAIIREFLIDSGYEVVDRRPDDTRDWAQAWHYGVRPVQGTMVHPAKSGHDRSLSDISVGSKGQSMPNAESSQRTPDSASDE